MGGPFLALYSHGPGVGVAETRAAIRGEEPVLAVVAMAMIWNGKWPAESILRQGERMRGAMASKSEVLLLRESPVQPAVKDALSINALSRYYGEPARRRRRHRMGPSETRCRTRPGISLQPCFKNPSEAKRKVSFCSTEPDFV
jgi:hypothetical protein